MIDSQFEIDEAELDQLRSQIQSQYPTASFSRKAVLLSNALWTKMTPYFESFEDVQKKALTLELFQTTLISNKPITAEEINAICIHYSLFNQQTPVVFEIQMPEITEVKTQGFTQLSFGLGRYFLLIMILLTFVGCSLGIVVAMTSKEDKVTHKVATISLQQFTQMSALTNQPIKPIIEILNWKSDLSFVPLNREKVTQLLKVYDSTLLSGSYIDTLESISKAENIHPALILSIIGQEQGFVAMSNPFREKILNNPYNLFGSWQKKQMTFERSTVICCRLINKLIETCPQDVNQIQWINQTYAQDEKWHVGVGYFFKVLTHE